MNRERILMGNPKLRERSSEVTEEDLESMDLKALTDDMFQLMRDEKCLAFAAPQIGVQKRIITIGFDKHPRRKDLAPVPYTVLINPSFKVIDDEFEEGYEGCWSIPGFYARVPRYKTIQYSGHNLEGKLIERIASGYHARVVQHEIDHLDGIVYFDRVKDWTTAGLKDELRKHYDDV